MNDFRLERIGSAAAGIAHDINNQLNLIVNHLSRADANGMPDVDAISEAREAVQRCATLTGSLLSYCTTVRLEQQSLDPAKLVRKFCSGLRLPDGVEVIVETPHSLPLIRGNSLAICRALTNLVSNAVDAMKGTGTIRVSARAGQISVSDAGPGIPEANFRKIFEPFFSTKGTGGCGLGLCIVRDLVREIGGYVEVKSELGVGTDVFMNFRKA